MWAALGGVLCGLGLVGLVLPGFPATVWFVLAAACITRGNPRWEAWLLSRPVVGQVVGARVGLAGILWILLRVPTRRP